MNARTKATVGYSGPDMRLKGRTGLTLAYRPETMAYEVEFPGTAHTWTIPAEFLVFPTNTARIPPTLAEAVGLKPATVPHDGKDDKGKPNPALLFEGCAGALAEVSKVLDGGAKKYAADSWQRVPGGIKRYKAAFYRHLQDMQVNGWDSVNTADFGLLHLDHAITDLLFIRSLMLKEKESNAI